MNSPDDARRQVSHGGASQATKEKAKRGLLEASRSGELEQIALGTPKEDPNLEKTASPVGVFEGMRGGLPISLDDPGGPPYGQVERANSDTERSGGRPVSSERSTDSKGGTANVLMSALMGGPSIPGSPAGVAHAPGSDVPPESVVPTGPGSSTLQKDGPPEVQREPGNVDSVSIKKKATQGLLEAKRKGELEAIMRGMPEQS